MVAMTFDTHAFVKELTKAGMPEEQAEVLARSQATLIDEKLATKQDLKELELRLKRDIQELKRDMQEMEANLKRDMKELEMRLTRDMQELKRDMKELEANLKRDMKELEMRLTRDMQEMELRLKHDLTVRLGSMMVVAIGVVAALVKLL